MSDLGICRDSLAFLGFTTTYKTRGDCQTTRKSYKTSHSVGWIVGWKKASMLILSGSFPQPHL